MRLWARFDFEGSTTGTVTEVFSFAGNPHALFPPEWAWVEAPDGTVQGATFDGSTWTHPEPPAPVEPQPEPEPARRTLLTPPEFKMQFTAAERVALRRFREASHTDDGLAEAAMIVDDWWQLIDDPRLQFVNLALPQTIEGVHGLVPLGLLSAERAGAILAGVEA